MALFGPGCLWISGGWTATDGITTCNPGEDPRSPPEASTAGHCVPQCLPVLGAPQVLPAPPHAIGLVAFGALQADELMDAVAAGPDWLRLHGGSRTTGLLGSARQTLSLPPGTRRSLAAGDVVLPHSGSWDGKPVVASGHEVLIGHPDGDEILLAFNLFSGGDPTTRDLYEWRVYSAWSDPAYDGGGLGTAVAWLPGNPGYVVASSPGTGHVVLLASDSVWDPLPPVEPPSFSLSLALSGPAASGFGRALAVDDLNEDGRSDLIVGNPDLGEVRVYWGCSASGPGLICPAGAPGPVTTALYTPVTSSIGEFGASIAAGAIDTSGTRGLIVGAPAAAGDHGAVCVVPFVGTTPGAPSCSGNPVPVGSAPADRFGQVVGLGNLAPIDNFARGDSDLALLPEVVVLAPGGSTVDMWADPALPYTSTGPDQGAAWVFRAGEGGPLIERPTPTLGNHMIWATDSPASGPWSHVVVGDIERNGSADLLLVEGDRMLLSRSAPAHGFDDVRIGAHEATIDGVTSAWDVFLTRQDRVGFHNRDQVVIEFFDDDGDLCVVEDGDENIVFDGTLTLPVDFVLLPTVDLLVGEADRSQCFKAGDGAEMDWVFSHDDVLEEYTVEPEVSKDCNPDPASFTLVRTPAGAPDCEP